MTLICMSGRGHKIRALEKGKQNQNFCIQNSYGVSFKLRSYHIRTSSKTTMLALAKINAQIVTSIKSSAEHEADQFKKFNFNFLDQLKINMKTD